MSKKNPIINQEITFQQNTLLQSKSKSLPQIPHQTINNTNNNNCYYTPSPLQHQLTRSSSTQSKHSNTTSPNNIPSTDSMNNYPSSQYVIKLNRTPSNLTPSQRLKLRKMNLNNSISQYKSDQTNIIKHSNKYVIDDKDEIIDDHVFNVPFSQQLTSSNDKFLFDNQSRTFSFATKDSTRTNSIISHFSFNDSRSSIGTEDLSHDLYKNSNQSTLSSSDFNKISKDAQELTVLFNKDEYSQIYDESFQKRKLLSNFKNLQILQTSTKNEPNFHTFTRPTWLPPKQMNEKIKHHQDADQILYNALYKENQLQQKRLIELNHQVKQRKRDIPKWEKHLLKLTAKNQIDFEKISNMVYTGVSSEIRSNVWWKINLLKHNNLFNEAFCDYYFDKFSIIQSKLNHLNQLNDDTNLEIIKHELGSMVFNFQLGDWVTLYNQIYKDLLNIYPDVNYFQDNQIMNKLIKTIVSFIIYLQEQFPSDGKDIFKYYIPGISHIISIFHFNYKNSYKSLVSICQLYQYRLPSMILTYRLGPKQTQSIIKESLNSYMIYKYEKMFKSHLPRLFIHFKIQNVSSFDYLPELILSLGSHLFNFDISSHLIDLVLLSMNNDEMILKVILNFIIRIQHKLYGSKEEILTKFSGINQNSNDTFTYVNVGYEVEFINCLKNI